MKICHFSDIHLSPLGHIPQSRTEQYHTDVANEIKILGQALKDEKADLIVCSGDIFHLKNQSAYSPKDLNYYRDLFEDFPPFCSIPGNHDLPKSAFQNIKDSPYTSLTNLLPTIIKDISWKTCVFPLEGVFKSFVLCGIPYLPMVSFKEEIKRFVEEKNNPLVLQHSPILWGFVIHVDATPEKLLVNLWESFSYEELASLFPNNSILFMGHIHASFLPWQDEKRNITISKPWSIGRVIKDYFNQTDILEKTHIPSYSVITLENTPEGMSLNISYKQIPGVKKGIDIFQVESLQTQLEKSKEIQTFIQGLKKDTSSSDSVFFTQNPMMYLQGLNLQKEIFDLITEYLNK